HFSPACLATGLLLSLHSLRIFRPSRYANGAEIHLRTASFAMRRGRRDGRRGRNSAEFHDNEVMAYGAALHRGRFRQDYRGNR
ncbi:hypothetical protein R3P38DRAFT_2980639, partial [Favolaschia claudopus]